MSSTSSSSFSHQQNEGNPRCTCGRTTIIQTSWTNANPGRRFLSCPQRSCNRYFRFIDPPMCDISKKLIPSLLKKMNKLREEKRKWKIATLILLFVFAVAVFLFVWIVFVSDGIKKKKASLKMLGH